MATLTREKHITNCTRQDFEALTWSCHIILTHSSLAKANYITMANSNGQKGAEPCVQRRTIVMGITVTPIIKYLSQFLLQCAYVIFPPLIDK